MASSTFHFVDEKDATRVAAGLKASIHNPNVSDEAKEHAADRLERMEDTATAQTGKADSRVLGGYKATLTVSSYMDSTCTTSPELTNVQNDKTSKDAKAHAREILEAHGYTAERAEGTSESEHETRVLAGYKAALSSKYIFRYAVESSSRLKDPRVSEEAKTHAKEYLQAHNAL